MTRNALSLFVLLIACSTRATPRPRAGAVPARGVDRTFVRVALPVREPRIGATSPFQWLGGDSATVFATGRPGEQWRVERDDAGRRVRAMRSDGVATVWQTELRARVAESGFLTADGKRYHGELRFVPMDGGVAFINRVGLEDYLRGVVPVEMGRRPPGDSSAMRAQAVASRSYALTRVNSRDAFDLRATTADQVYGGVDVENPLANDAIDDTRGLVLLYEGRIVDAPFHSTCGGSTARANEIWRTPGAGYLQNVSDRIGSTDRYYCDAAPRFRWTRTLSANELDAALTQYLAAYAAVPGGQPGRARAIGVRDRTASGRVGMLDVETDKRIFTLRGNDIRYVMRQPGGEILPSTYFSVEPEIREGVVSRVTFRGQGNGHGVGMCQWGAIGRARAGQSFRTILGTYFPGTRVGPAPNN